MSQQERKQIILEMIERDHMVKAAELVERFGVSVETVRRDLEELERNGSLRRVYGGAVLGTIYGPEPSYKNRQIVNAAKKRAIAATVYELIQAGDTLFLDGGTTMQEIARCIAEGEKRGITAITSSVKIACEIVQNSDCSVILLGGVLTGGEHLTTGVLCSSNLQRFHANKIIMGAAGISPFYGVTDCSVDIGATKRDMIARSDQVICAADASKFGRTATNCICDIGQISTLVTDWSAEPQQYTYCVEAGVRVIQAPAPKHGKT